MTLNKSYIIIDSHNEELFKKGPMLIDEGYIIKTFSLNDTDYSHNYNPLRYVFDKNGNFSEERASVIINSYIRECLGEEDPYKNVVEKTFMEGIRNLSVSDTETKDLMGLLNVFKRWSNAMELVSLISDVDNVMQHTIKMLINDLTSLLFEYDGRYILTDAEENTVLHMMDVDIENLGLMKMVLFIDMDGSNVSVKKWINSLLLNQCSIILSESKKAAKYRYCLMHNGEALDGMFDTRKEASEYKDMFSHAYISGETEQKVFDDGKLCLVSESGDVIAYLLNRSEGEKLISDYKEAEVIRYEKEELPF